MKQTPQHITGLCGSKFSFDMDYGLVCWRYIVFSTIAALLRMCLSKFCVIRWIREYKCWPWFQWIWWPRCCTLGSDWQCRHCQSWGI